MRSHEAEINAAGARLAAIGTGDRRFGEDFVRSCEITFPVLLDDDGAAARAASVKGGMASALRLATPNVLKRTREARSAGFRQTGTGKRPLQLGATFVLGPGSQVVYAHLDADVADHAPIPEVLAAVRS